MLTTTYRLENSWHSKDGIEGSFAFTLHNLGEAPLAGFRLVYTSMTRTIEPSAIENARLVLRDANHHAMEPPDGLSIPPGGSWTFKVGGLQRAARHRCDGATSAYLTLASGEHVSVAVSDLLLETSPEKASTDLLPNGDLGLSFAIQPWPREVEARLGGALPVVLYPVAGTELDDKRAVVAVAALTQRLFPADAMPFNLAANPQGRGLRLARESELAAESYALAFESDAVRLGYGGPAGRQYGLTTLAQMMRGACADPHAFSFPASGRITDGPRYGWRGCHLDVSRQFFPTPDVVRLLDIMAWLKLNVFHWHLTDDEAWRLEIKAFPVLTTVGVTRGPDEPLRPQLGNGAEPVGSFYTQAEVQALVAHAAALRIEVLPEIDVPGHCTAALAALPHLADGQEAPGSYHSVQGYTNNALNPAVEETYAFLGTVFDEITALFPSPYIHIGGDEVAKGTWMTSPRAKALMAASKIDGTFGLQSHFLFRVQAMLHARGRKLAGWNEVAKGGGVDPNGTLLMAWERPEVGIDLARDGYDLVMTPGQAYYLDMVQADAWTDIGASWAGTVPPKQTYAYEAEDDFPDELRPRIKGVQACIWSEYITSRAYFNRLVFPRLPAVAESAWTPKDRKDWGRFATIVPLSPTL